MALSELTQLPAAVAPQIEATPLTEQYRRVREATVALCATLAPEDFVVQSMPDASPAKWHLAHTSWFFEEFVLQHAPGPWREGAYEFHNASFRYLFNSYYNAVGPMLHPLEPRAALAPDRATGAGLPENDRRANARAFREGPRPAARQRTRALGLHHEQQHQELLLTDIKHLFSCNPLLPAFAQQSPRASRAAATLAYKQFDGGLLEIGHHGTGFAFDNESPRVIARFSRPSSWRSARRQRPVPGVRPRRRRLIVRRTWLSDGWALVKSEQWTRPMVLVGLACRGIHTEWRLARVEIRRLPCVT